jgi:basic amino acid/polyamine antiporter, APA family
MAAAQPETPETPLKRAIGAKLLLVFVIGDVLGAGIYALVGEVSSEVGGAIWTAFTAALVLAALTAFAYAELVTKYPMAAGSALYVNRAYDKPFFTFMVAFAVMCSGLASAATLATAFGGDYLSVFVDIDVKVVGILFLVVMTAINFRGIGESVKVNVVLTTIELSGLLLVVLIGAAYLLGGDGDPGRALEFSGDESVPLAIMGGAGLAFFALIGFEDSVNVAEEAENPRRDYPWALFGGLLIAGFVYILVTVIASMAVPTGTLADSDGPLLEVVQLGPLAISTKVFSAIALFALANGALINLIMASRLIYGMSREGILPAVFSRVLPSRRTPYAAIAFTAAIAAALVLVGELSDLADTTVLLLLLVFTAVNVAVLVLRRDTVRHEHFRAPTALPVIGAIVSLALLTTKDGEIFLRAAILLAIGAALWAITWYLHGRHQSSMDNGVFQPISRPDERGDTKR